MRPRVLVFAAVVAVVSIVAPAWAEQGDMRVQFGLLYNMPTDDLDEPGETLEADSVVGFQFSFERMVTDLIGIEPGLSFADHEIEIEAPGAGDLDLGDVDFMALTANINFHVKQTDRIDVYVGPTIGYVFWGDLETSLFGPPEEIGTDDDFTYGANFGLDVPFGGGKWAFSGGLTYLFSDIALEGNAGMTASPDLGVDPFQIKVGVSYNF